MIKISKLEFITILLCAAFLAFAAGWFLRTPSAGPIRVEVQRTAEMPSGVPSPTAAGGPTAGVKVNLNTADAAELETLPGIGEKRARDIVAWREANGPFRIPEDLTRVQGIGEGTLKSVIDYITVGEDAR